MDATLETHAIRPEWFPSSHLRAPVTLRAGPLRLSLDPDGSLRYLDSLRERRLLFGREQLHFYKIRSGVILQFRPSDWRVDVSPASVSFSGRIYESLEVTQTVKYLSTSSPAFARSIGLRNVGSTPVELRIIAVSDPTAAHFREANSGWGALGVNAFNRRSHVAMDEVAGKPAARVIGSKPSPKLIYMTSDSLRAQELIQAGELPESTAGMSGQVVAMQQHELELGSGESEELKLVSVYNPEKLEGALSDFEGAFSTAQDNRGTGASAAASSAAISSGFLWARSSLEGAEFEENDLDRLETLRGIVYLDPNVAREIIMEQAVGKSGSVGHSLEKTKPGLLESSIFLQGASMIALLTGERRYIRSTYSRLRRVANFLMASSSDGSVPLDPALPQGWRRLVGSGYPTGEVPEVSVSVAGALSTFATLALALGRAEDSARFTSGAKMIVSRVKSRLVDGRGFLVLSLENGKVRADDSVDQAVACYRHPFDRTVSSAEVRRLLEKDFACKWGPRTVPTSNLVYSNASYGQGQLGGYWTRAALAFATAGYRSGLAGIGSLQLEEVGRLVSAEVAQLGGAPGEFPYWVDPQKNEAHGTGSDPVAASRFVEALVCGDAGFNLGPKGPEFHPAGGSRLKWLLLKDFWIGRRASVFIGRSERRIFTFVSLAEASIDQGWRYSAAEGAETHNRDFAAVTFYGPGQDICVGNMSRSSGRSRIVLRPREPELTKHLSVGLYELDPSAGSWNRLSTVRVLTSIGFEVDLGPGEWRAFRLAAT